MVKNDRAILRAGIGSLSIQGRRIMIGPENIEQFFVTDDRRIELDLDNLGVSRLIGADIFVGRILGRASAYPTAASVTPWMLRKVDSTPQKQPAPNVAFSVVIRCMMKRESFRRKAATLLPNESDVVVNIFPCQRRQFLNPDQLAGAVAGIGPAKGSCATCRYPAQSLPPVRRSSERANRYARTCIEMRFRSSPE